MEFEEKSRLEAKIHYETQNWLICELEPLTCPVTKWSLQLYE